MDLDVIAGDERLRTSIDFAQPGLPPQTLILHGAGSGTRVRTQYLAREIARLGKSTIRFDFSGHGDSSGTLGSSSLQKRLDEALSISNLLDQTRPLTVIGNSMGGYVAARLTRHLKIDHLVLMCPAAYAPEADRIQFSAGFKEIISQPYSYHTSRTFEDVADFSGRVSIVVGTEDKVIPGEIIELYKKAASTRSNECNILSLLGAPHLLHPWLEQNLTDRNRFLNLIKT